MLFDKDEDGILAFGELEVVMRCLGQRPSGDLISRQFFTIVFSRGSDLTTNFENVDILHKNVDILQLSRMWIYCKEMWIY